MPAPLEPPALFAQAVVANSGAVVIWEDDTDLAIDAAHLETRATDQRA